MSEDPRAPQHPSDIPSSRTTGNSAASGPPPPYYQPTPPPAPQGSSNNSQTRNIIIGAIATIIASTSVYYLTQYVNNRRPEAAAASFPVIKDATVTAWKTYVTIDNIYYKNLLALGRNKALVADLDNYEVEVNRETEKFIKDAGNLINDKSIDNTFVTMMKRRIKREKDAGLKTSAFYSSLRTIARSNMPKEEKEKKLFEEITSFRQYAHTLFEMSATEIEDLSKTLSEKFMTSFDPMQVMIYADYKNGAFNDQSASHDHPENLVPAKNIDPQKLAGVWTAQGSTLSLNRDGTMNYALVNGDSATGTWKLDSELLKVEGVNTKTKQKSIYLFNLYNMTPDSFTMMLTSPPYDSYNVKRQK